MRSESEAAALARALLTIREDGQWCHVTVCSGVKRAELSVRNGCIVALEGVDAEPLGDTLLRHGVLDLARHAEMLGQRNAGERVGQWLVRVGATDARAVEHALVLQTLGRVSELLCWRAPRYVLRRGVALGPRTALPGVPLATAVWFGLVARFTSISAPGGAAGAATLSDLGIRLQGRLAAHGVDTALWKAALAGGSKATAERRALAALGALRSVRASRGDAHGLLLRKRSEARRQVPPHELLGVPADAPTQLARRAYRQLVRELHPDRFGDDNPFIVACSGEVVRALSQAVRRYAPTSLNPDLTAAATQGCAVP